MALKQYTYQFKSDVVLTREQLEFLDEMFGKALDDLPTNDPDNFSDIPDIICEFGFVGGK